MTNIQKHRGNIKKLSDLDLNFEIENLTSSLAWCALKYHGKKDIRQESSGEARGSEEAGCEKVCCQESSATGGAQGGIRMDDDFAAVLERFRLASEELKLRAARRPAEVLTPKQFSGASGWSERTTMRAIRSGRIAAIQVGGRWLILAAGLATKIGRR